MAIRNTLIDAYGLNSPGVNLLDHAGNHDYSGFNPSNSHQNIQINHDNINNYIHITQNSASITGAYRYVNNIESGKIYNLSFYVYSEYSGTLRNCFENSTEIYGSNLTFNANEWNKCWITSKAVDKNIVFYVKNTSFKIRNIKLTECTKKDCYFFQYTDINDELKPFVYNFKDLQTNCRYTEYFTDDNPINELISWENFKYLLKEFVEYEEWQYSDDKSYRTRNTISIIDWCDGSNKSSVSNTEREDATIEYGTPELTLVVNDIPASGGTISNGTVSYGQSKYYVYSDVRFKVTDESGIITEGLTWGDSVTAQSLGTTIKDRSIVGSLSVSTTINGKTESTTADVYQQANRIESYGTPTGRTLSVSDIPASGGTISRGTLGGTITQSCIYTSGSNGTLTNPTITSSSYSASITAESLGTAIKDRTKIGTLTYTYVCNKKTGSVSADVYQQANNATDITYGDWAVSLSANKYTTSSSPAPAGGGTAVITSSASRTRTQNYTSGATSKLSNETATPTLSISGTGFSLSGSNVAVANRATTEGSSRTGSITATYGGVSKSITLYQAENKLVAVSATGSASTGTVLNVSPAGGTVTWSPVVEYSSGWSGTPPSGVTITYSVAGEGATQSNNITTWANRGSIIGSWRGANVTLSAKSSYTTNPVIGVVSTVQNLNTITDIRITNGSGSTPVTSVGASGGTVEVFPRLSFSSGEYQFVLNYSKLGSWSGTGTGFTVSDITTSSSTGRRIVAASRGTTIGVDRSITSTYTLNTTINGVAINKSATLSLTQALNKVVSCTESNNTLSYPSIAAGGGTSSPSGMTTARFTYSSGASGDPSGYVWTKSFSMTSANGFSINTSTGVVTATNNTTTSSRTSNTITRTAKISYTNPSSVGGDTVSATLTKTATCTQSAGTKTYANPVVSLSYATIPAKGGTVTPTLSYSQTWGWNGATSGGGTITSGAIIRYSGTSVNTTSGAVSASSKGTNISNVTTVTTATVTVTLNGKSGSKSATIQQAGNYVASFKVFMSTFSYDNISAGSTSATPKLVSRSPNIEYTFSSGSTSNATPSSTYGTYSSTVSYKLGSVINGFTAVNSSSGVLTATNRGTTIGNARTSGIVTRTLVGTWTPTSNYNAARTKMYTGSSTATCTQALNKVESCTVLKNELSYPAIAAAGGTSNPVGAVTVTYNYSSGATGSPQGTTTTISYSMPATSGFSINTTSGVVTATNNTSTSSRTSGTITRTVKYSYTNPSSVGGDTVSATLTKTATCTQSAGTKTYANPVVSLSYATIPAKGGTVTPTLSYSQTWGWNGATSGGGTITSGAIIRYSGTSVNTTSGAVSASSKGTNISNVTTVTTATVTVTLNGKSGSKSATIQQAGNYVASFKVFMSTFSYDNISAGSTSATPKLVSRSPNIEYTFSSGSTSNATPSSTYGTYSSTVSYKLGSVINGFTAVNSSSGVLTATNRGTTIGNARTSGIVTRTLVGTWTPTSNYNAARTKMYTGSSTATCTQALNKVIAVALIPSSGNSDTTNYPSGNFTAAGGTKSPTLNCIQKLTLSSGSIYNTTGSGSFLGGTSSISRTWSMTPASGFSMNTSTGVVTASNRGTTVGAARTCNPKCVISGSFTNPSSVGGVVKATSVTDSFTLTQAANSMTREYSNLVGHITSTTWANKANYTNFWATGDYTEKYTSGATGTSGSGSVPWDSVTFGGADWVYYDSVQGVLKWYDNTGLERSTTITGRIGSWTYSVKVTQKAGMSIGRLYLHVPVNVGYIAYWNIYVNSTSGGQIWSGHPDVSGSANNTLKMPEECAIIVAQNGGTVSFSTTYSTATDRNYIGSISGTEQDRLAEGEDVTVYLT